MEVPAPRPLPESCRDSRLRKVGNIAAATVLVMAGLLIPLAPLATALTTAGAHVAVKDGLRAIQSDRVSSRLSRAPLRVQELRHLGEVVAAVVLITAGMLIGSFGALPLSVPLIVEGIELGVHAASQLREDLLCERRMAAARAAEQRSAESASVPGI